jgi:hypothetical protein
MKRKDVKENLGVIRSRIEEARRVLVRDAMVSTAAGVLLLGAGWLWGGTLLDYLVSLPVAVRWVALGGGAVGAILLLRAALVKPMVRYAEDVAAARIL